MERLTTDVLGAILRKTTRQHIFMVAATSTEMQRSVQETRPIIIESPGFHAVISVGRDHNVLVTAAGYVYSWGKNGCGRLGTGDNENCGTPSQVNGLASMAFAAAGGGHSLFVKQDGTLLSCGRRFRHGSATDAEQNLLEPIVIRGLLEERKVVQVAAGVSHTVCLTAFGEVFSWGHGAEGQLGVGNFENSIEPVLVQGLLIDSRVEQVGAGGTHSLAITVEGAVYSWGCGRHGQLGLGSTESQNEPSKLCGELEGFRITRVAGGGWHSACVSENGVVFCWGYGADGQLGLGNKELQLEPTPLKTGLLQRKKIVEIAAGASHTVCLCAHGVLFSWGNNAQGALGQGDTKTRYEAAIVQSLVAQPISQVAAGAWHTACVGDDGTVWAWGKGTDGRLGLGHDLCCTSPAMVAKYRCGELVNQFSESG